MNEFQNLIAQGERSLREQDRLDRFAAAALAGLCARRGIAPGTGAYENTARTLARDSWYMAREMLAQEPPPTGK